MIWHFVYKQQTVHNFCLEMLESPNVRTKFAYTIMKLRVNAGLGFYTKY